MDATTGLYYYGYRFYDTLTGRWPSRDPIGETGGVNLYGFVNNDGVNRWDLYGLVEVTQGENKTVNNQKGKFGSVGVYFTATFKKTEGKEPKKCCYTGDKVIWHIQKNMPPRDIFGVPDWKHYEKNKNKDWLDRYMNDTPYTYEGLDAHESTHVRQYEGLKNEIKAELEARFSKEFCYETAAERDKNFDASTKNYATPKPTAIAAFEKKYGPSGANRANRAEREAMENEYKEYERQYNEWKNKQ